jgi:uncharacterized protein involved in exopolysaccharide biosynthesis/Mrp family chromosome partitioning ATPase
MRMTMSSPLRAGAPAGNEGISFTSVFGALRRRKWLILLTLLLVNGLVFGAAMLLTPRYSATATLMIDPPGRRALDGGAGVAAERGLPADAALMPTQLSLLRSPTLAMQVIAVLRLEDDSELQPGEPLLARLRQFLSEQPLTSSVAEWWPAPGGSMMEERTVVPRFLDRLAVSQQGESRVISVTYRSGDPNKAALVANTVVQQYLDTQVRARSEFIDRTQRWVSERATELQQQLQDAEATVTDYMARHGLVRIGSSGPDAQQPPSLRREMAVTRAERATKDARLAQLEALRSRGGSMLSLPEVAGSVIIQNLQQQASLLRAREAQATSIFGANHPSLREVRSERESVDARITAEVDNVVRSIAEDAARARIREREMEQLLKESVSRDIGAERASVRLNELTRVVDTKSTQYQALLVRLDEINERREMVEPGAELVAAASVPQDRDFPRLRILLGAGFMGSLVLSLGFAALAENQDRYLRAGHHVETTLGLPNLALVPSVKRRALRRQGALHRYALEHPQSAYTEAIRGLSIAIDCASAEKPTRVLLVTSALPGEGKTALAISLAAVAARRGRRVVVVDLDLRHPSVAPQLGLAPHPGLVEYMEGQHTLHEVTQSTGGEFPLHTIAVHRPVENPADILDSPRLRELITLLRIHYDMVVLDVPPSLGITDALTIGLLADTALFIARWGTTRDSAAANGVAALENAGINIIGCALTQVDLQQHARYGYQDAGQYYRSYRKYFQQ